MKTWLLIACAAIGVYLFFLLAAQTILWLLERYITVLHICS